MKSFTMFYFTGILASVMLGSVAMSKETTKAIKTYMPFSIPVDPANIRTLVDLDLSYALASTLVAWSATKEPVSALAESWEVTGETEVTFRISKTAKWSDGSPITAEQTVKSFNRAKKVHIDSLKGLFELIEKIEAKDSSTIVFKLKMPFVQSGLVRKLTEPMYGVLKVNADDSLDLTKTTGPFTLASVSDSELKLMVNKNWASYRTNMPEAVIIRRPPVGEELQESFLKDSWANLIGASSLVPEIINQKYKQAQYAIWNRSLDKVFFFSPSPKLANPEGRALFNFLNSKIDRSKITSSLSGYNIAEQFFPQGYVLFDPDFSKGTKPVDLPATFRKRPLVVLCADARVGAVLRENIKTTLKSVTGVEPKFKIVTLSEFEKNRAEGEYDVLAGSLPVNDPNIDGSISFFFGLSPAIIPNAGEGSKNFQSRIDNAKKLSDQMARNLEYRKVFSEAAKEASIIPLFHYSTIVIAKENIDLSAVPTSDETVAFSKVKFR